MPATSTAGVYMLDAQHADAIARLAVDPAAAALLGISHPPGADAGRQAVERATAERLAGTTWTSVIVDRRDVKGFCALAAAATADPDVRVWIAPEFRRAGYGSLGVRLTLDFAFRNLQFQRVHAAAKTGDPAAERTLAKFGFTRTEGATHDTAWLATSDVSTFSVTRAAWLAHRDRPAIAALHPALRAILEAELAAGNEIAETGGGWPDADSVFVRLRDPFRTRPTALPAGIVYTEPNDPHWWKADYTSQSPRHILAC